jgi:hypothetical protein
MPPAKSRIPHLCRNTTSPDHMNDQEIDEQELNRKKDQVRDETDPVGKRAGDEGGCDDGKHHLVRNEHDYWYIVIHRKDIVTETFLRKAISRLPIIPQTSPEKQSEYPAMNQITVVNPIETKL